MIVELINICMQFFLLVTADAVSGSSRLFFEGGY